MPSTRLCTLWRVWCSLPAPRTCTAGNVTASHQRVTPSRVRVRTQIRGILRTQLRPSKTAQRTATERYGLLARRAYCTRVHGPACPRRSLLRSFVCCRFRPTARSMPSAPFLARIKPNADTMRTTCGARQHESLCCAPYHVEPPGVVAVAPRKLRSRLKGEIGRFPAVRPMHCTLRHHTMRWCQQHGHAPPRVASAALAGCGLVAAAGGR